jgi:hypothetical protein
MQMQNPRLVQPMLLHRILRILLQPTISVFNLQTYWDCLKKTYPQSCAVRGNETDESHITEAGPIRALYDWATACSEDAASALLWKL